VSPTETIGSDEKTGIHLDGLEPLPRKSKDTGEVVKPATDSFKGECMYQIQPKKSSMLLLGRKGK
jgi:hypothetical protein